MNSQLGISDEVEFGAKAAKREAGKDAEFTGFSNPLDRAMGEETSGTQKQL